jgi:hypothetical protein
MVKTIRKESDERWNDNMNIEFQEITENELDEVISIYTYYAMNTTATFHAHKLSKAEMREIVISENQNTRHISSDLPAISADMSL